MHRLPPLLSVGCLLACLLAAGSLSAAKPQPPADPHEELDRWLIQEKIEFDEAAISFYHKMLEAGCTPAAALRWTRLALFADRDWNLAELSGIVEEQQLAGATRQVVEAEVEKRIQLRARELRVDLAGFSLTPPAGAGRGAKTKAPAGEKAKPKK